MFTSRAFAGFITLVSALGLGDAVPMQNRDVIAPPTITYGDLLNEHLFASSGASTALEEAMTTTGLIAISGIPDFANLRRDVLVGSYKCSAEASSAKTVELQDGTTRRTIAGVTKGVEDEQDMEFGADAGACSSSFRQTSTVFRRTVSKVADAFADRMSALFSLPDAPMLWNSNGTRAYNSFRDIVHGADHLEHFHTYSQRSATKEASVDNAIDLHTDQGLFIAFTPALMIADESGGQPTPTSSPAGTFFLENKDKTRVALEFGSGDVLVFMLGDGVEQYYNHRLRPGQPRLRSAPHGMSMPQRSRGESRVWYGRMFLPPNDALSEEHGLPFGKVREMAIQDVNSKGGLGSGIGCSRRLLQSDADPECGENQMYCWHQCMDYTAEASPAVCAEQGLKLQCMNQRDQIVDINAHGDHNPTCSNSETDETAPDPIPQPAASLGCDDAARWESYLGLSGYSNSLEIHANKTYVMWNVIEGDKVKMRMAYKGYLGYFAVGIADKRTRAQGSSHPGMNGANTIMGIYDPDPEIFGAPFVGTSVAAYTIHHDLSAFRHWVDTAERLPAGAAMEVSDCYASVEFEVAAIHGQALNFTAGTTNDLVWAIHEDSLLKGYHGYCNKGRMDIDFTATVGHAQYQWPGNQAFCYSPSPPSDSDSDEDEDDSQIQDPKPATAAGSHSTGINNLVAVVALLSAVQVVTLRAA